MQNFAHSVSGKYWRYSPTKMSILYSKVRHTVQIILTLTPVHLYSLAATVLQLKTLIEIGDKS